MGIDGIEKENNPLAFVDRLLDGERDSFLHFGDVRFWRHIEYIDRKQIYRTSSIEFITMKLMFFEAFFYLVFLTSLTLFIVETRPTSLYEAGRQQLDYWGDCKRGIGGGRGEGGCKIDEVANTEDFMHWMKDDFIPKAFTAADLYEPMGDSTSLFRLQKGIANWKPRYVGDTMTAIMLGVMRVRQLRVQYNKDCVIKDEHKDIHKDCFPAFSERFQSRLPWAPTWTPEHLKQHFVWMPAKWTKMTTALGQHGEYPPDGFLFDLPMNLTGAQTRIMELVDWKWVDMRTRAVVIEWSILNANVNVLVHNRMLFEFPATGGALARHEAFPFRIQTLSLPLMLSDDIIGFILLVITCSMHFCFMAYFSFLLSQNGLKLFHYFWSWIDLAIITIFIICVTSSLAVWSNASKMPDLAPETIGDPDMYFPIGELVPTIELSNCFLAILGLLSWLKIIKYFTLMGYKLTMFVRVIERCLFNLVLFGGLMVVVLFGFAAAFYIGYGGERDLFSTIMGSFVACIVAPVGGVSLEPIFRNQDFLGPMLVVAYFLVVVLLLLNTFLAICADTYTVVCYELNEVKKVEATAPAKIFLWTYMNAIIGVKLIGKETEEDKGTPEEQEIAYTSLPEAITNRFDSTFHKMRSIVEVARDEMQQKENARKRLAGYDVDSGMAHVRNATKTEDLPMLQDLTINPMVDKSEEEIVQEEMAGRVIKRVQLQRMLDDDAVLREICGTTRAIDVIRRFRMESSQEDPFVAVQKLQERVTQLLRDIEHKGTKLCFNELQTLQTVSQELHSALTDSQREWRAELLSVLQMATLLSKALVHLTKKLEQIQLNHKELAQRTAPAHK
eukprot:TRINITY_DN30147_c0_g1_i1.p1 TRINITY_DN30147_c0_g1~~TRINITY_DN30147_c0_g1_i1.p1  ORF type:complete len:839 (-),score=225.99 TRINITY_DN30147_c0_g1_i1:143-2659(-)